MSGYIGTQPVPQATQTRETFTATAGQASFATAGYTPNYLDVWLNGVKMVNGTDFTATNGSDVVLTSGAADGDTLEVLAFSTFDLLSQSFGGDLSVNSGNGNTVSMTTDGSVEIQKSNGQAYIDFKGSNVDYDCRIAQYNDGLKFEVGGSGSSKTALTLDSNGNSGFGTDTPAFKVDVLGNGTLARFTGDGAAYQGISVRNNYTSGSNYGGVFFDTINENAAAIANFVGEIHTDGSSSWFWSTQPAGTRTDRRSVTMRLDGAGNFTVPNQPRCRTTLDGGWRTLTAGSKYGLGNIYDNVGGFYSGASLNGFNVVHVPVTGRYRIGLGVYIAANNSGRRIYVQRNGGAEIVWVQTNSSTNDFTQYQSEFVDLVAGDYLNYEVIFADLNCYNALRHTYVTIELIG